MSREIPQCRREASPTEGDNHSMKQLLLQDAIILGDTLKACVPSQWLSSNGSCGCALGGALLATGADPVEVYRQTEEAENTKLPINEIPAIKDRWPWLT